MADETYTPEEIAKQLKISKYTVYELIKRGELNAFRIGNKMRIDGKDLEAFKLGSQTKAASMSESVNQTIQGHPVRLAGSHDFILEHFVQFMTDTRAKLSIQPSYVGSLEGLMYVFRGQADVAAIHLLNADTDEYNIPFIKQLFIQDSITLIRLASRRQGFIVQKGNPRNIKGFQDLCDGSVRFVNRQKGSGTRLLFDQFLKKYSINPLKIQGYDVEHWNHLATAGEVVSGRADVTFGIEHAADQLNLEFIPVTTENFDLLFKWNNENEDALKRMIEAMKSEAFLNSLSSITGYSLEELGKVMYSTT